MHYICGNVAQNWVIVYAAEYISPAWYSNIVVKILEHQP